MYQYHLPHQEKDEKILLVLRRFWTVFVFKALLILFYLAIPAIVWFIIFQFASDVLESAFGQILGLFFGLYCLFILFFGLISWINYYFDVWIVTSKRIISIDQISLFERVTSETRLERIQDITVEVRGFLPSLFHFGNVYVQTAGERPRFAFEQIPRPYRVRKLISDLHRKALREQEMRYAEPRREEVEYKKELPEKRYKERPPMRSVEPKPSVEPRPEKPKPEEPKEGLGKISDYRK